MAIIDEVLEELKGNSFFDEIITNYILGALEEKEFLDELDICIEDSIELCAELEAEKLEKIKKGEKKDRENLS